MTDAIGKLLNENAGARERMALPPHTYDDPGHGLKGCDAVLPSSRDCNRGPDHAIHDAGATLAVNRWEQADAVIRAAAETHYRPHSGDCALCVALDDYAGTGGE